MPTIREKQEILELLETSSISEHKKKLVRILLDVMEKMVIKDLLATLRNEDRSMKKLNNREKVAELKYRVSVERHVKRKE